MIKNVSVMVTDECNSRCATCDIWAKKSTGILSAGKFGELFARPEFAEIEDLSITGGEPTLRNDLIEVTNRIVEGKEKLRMLFLCSNGTNPDMAAAFVEEFQRKISNVFVAVSLEGQREVHKKIRGIDNYSLVLKTIQMCKQVSQNVHTILSSTITPENCNKEDLMHIREIAMGTNSTFSFKPVIHGGYYGNERKVGKFVLSDDRLRLLKDFISRYCMDDPFMRAQLEYLNSGKVPLMGDKKTGVKCLAGDIFAFANASGDISPCCHSSRKIGDAKSGMYIKDRVVTDLGKHEPCPCCNEMCFYPMLNWADYSSKPSENDR